MAEPPGAPGAAPGPVWRPAGRPPEVLLTARATLRRLGPGDAEQLATAVLASVDHLRTWMPWADAYDQAAALTYATQAEVSWAEGAQMSYRIDAPTGAALPRSSDLLGAISLTARIGPGGLEIGYWLRADAVGRGLATAAAAAVTVAALGMPDVSRVEIHHDVDNGASGAIPRRLGFTRLADEHREPEAPAETGILACWSLTAEAFPGSPAAAMGRRTDIPL